MYRKIFLISTVVVMIVGAVYWFMRPQKIKAPSHVSQTASTTSQTASFNKSRYSIDTPGSVWWIVSRTRPLPDGYVPGDLVTPRVTLNTQKSADENMLRADAGAAVEKLFSGAKSAGFDFMLASGYRSQALQATYYNNYVAQFGQAEADTFSARPGTSEHQTGLALDVARADRVLYLDQAFGKDPSGQWLAAHAYEYGYIVRYPEGKDATTGYEYEPWHIRYVGTDLAAELHRTGQTMEEFFGL